MDNFTEREQEIILMARNGSLRARAYVVNMLTDLTATLAEYFAEGGVDNNHMVGAKRHAFLASEVTQYYCRVNQDDETSFDAE